MVVDIDPDLARGARSFAYWYNAHDQQWTISPAMQIPGVGCREGCKLVSTQNQWPTWDICDECKSFFNFYTSFFPIALMAANGDFAETEERQELPQFTEQEIRKVRRPGSGKYDEVPVTHTYHAVSFDMSVKKHTSSHAPQPHESDGPTWLEQAMANETVLYVSKHIAQTKRTFKHDRYVNMRGKTIDVRAHEKRIPMSINRLKQTIHKVVASKQ